MDKKELRSQLRRMYKSKKYTAVRLVEMELPVDTDKANTIVDITEHDIRGIMNNGKYVYNSIIDYKISHCEDTNTLDIYGVPIP